MDARPLDEPLAAGLGPAHGARALVCPVIRRFCTGALPTFHTEDDHRGRPGIFVADGDTGRSGAIDVCLGEVIGPGPAPTASHKGERGEFFARLYVPSERLVHEVLVHGDLVRGAWAGVPVEHEVLAELSLARVFPFDRAGKTALVSRRALEGLGPALACAAPAAPSQHGAMVEWFGQWARAQAGVEVGDFHAFRAELVHPPVPATSVTSLLLPGA
jgi:hypothetical protein